MGQRTSRVTEGELDPGGLHELREVEAVGGADGGHPRRLPPARAVEAQEEDVVGLHPSVPAAVARPCDRGHLVGADVRTGGEHQRSQCESDDQRGTDHLAFRVRLLGGPGEVRGEVRGECEVWLGLLDLEFELLALLIGACARLLPFVLDLDEQRLSHLLGTILLGGHPQLLDA